MEDKNSIHTAIKCNATDITNTQLGKLIRFTSLYTKSEMFTIINYTLIYIKSFTKKNRIF